MSLNNYAYYAISTGLIENVLWIEDAVSPTLDWPEGYAIVDIPDGLVGEYSMCGIGWSYIDGQFIEPPMPVPVEGATQPVSTGSQTL